MKKLKNLNILIVDDEDSLRQVISSALSAQGALISEAPNGNEAFELIKQNKFDMVISDIRMPGGDGLILLRDVQAMAGPKPKVIIITGYSGVSVQEVLKMGAVALLPKPFSREKLVECVFQQM